MLLSVFVDCRQCLSMDPYCIYLFILLRVFLQGSTWRSDFPFKAEQHCMCACSGFPLPTRSRWATSTFWLLWAMMLMDVGTRLSLWISAFSPFQTQRWVSGSNGNCTVSFSRSIHAIFYGSCAVVPLCQLSGECQHLRCLTNTWYLFLFACYLFEILICVYLTRCWASS